MSYPKRPITINGPPVEGRNIHFCWTEAWERYGIVEWHYRITGDNSDSGTYRGWVHAFPLTWIVA